MSHEAIWQRITFIEAAARADLIRSRKAWAKVRAHERSPEFLRMIELLTTRRLTGSNSG